MPPGYSASLTDAYGHNVPIELAFLGFADAIGDQQVIFPVISGEVAKAQTDKTPRRGLLAWVLFASRYALY